MGEPLIARVQRNDPYVRQQSFNGRLPHVGKLQHDGRYVTERVDELYLRRV